MRLASRKFGQLCLAIPTSVIIQKNGGCREATTHPHPMFWDKVVETSATGC